MALMKEGNAVSGKEAPANALGNGRSTSSSTGTGRSTGTGSSMGGGSSMGTGSSSGGGKKSATGDDKEAGPEPVRRQTAKVGRNDACPCGSGKKFKKCHGQEDGLNL